MPDTQTGTATDAVNTGTAKKTTQTDASKKTAQTNDTIKTIRNPLTIIGVFSGVAQTTGVAILPLISASLQATFIWFLMVFPILLLIFFFVTLFFRSKALYAPRDYRDERDYILMMMEDSQHKLKELAKRLEEQPKRAVERDLLARDEDNEFIPADSIKLVDDNIAKTRAILQKMQM
jgi:hypothetical protein